MPAITVSPIFDSIELQHELPGLRAGLSLGFQGDVSAIADIEANIAEQRSEKGGLRKVHGIKRNVLLATRLLICLHSVRIKDEFGIVGYFLGVVMVKFLHGGSIVLNFSFNVSTKFTQNCLHCTQFFPHSVVDSWYLVLSKPCNVLKVCNQVVHRQSLVRPRIFFMVVTIAFSNGNEHIWLEYYG